MGRTAGAQEHAPFPDERAPVGPEARDLGAFPCVAAQPALEPAPCVLGHSSSFACCRDSAHGPCLAHLACGASYAGEGEEKAIAGHSDNAGRGHLPLSITDRGAFRLIENSLMPKRRTVSR